MYSFLSRELICPFTVVKHGDLEYLITIFLHEYIPWETYYQTDSIGASFWGRFEIIHLPGQICKNVLKEYNFSRVRRKLWTCPKPLCIFGYNYLLKAIQNIFKLISETKRLTKNWKLKIVSSQATKEWFISYTLYSGFTPLFSRCALRHEGTISAIGVTSKDPLIWDPPNFIFHWKLINTTSKTPTLIPVISNKLITI